ncbi:hypothetical protein ACIA8K_29575 [Catenuloplanes sp. NPDC051500]|uniref:hypothetical protein n=1 Tax=Catenuloplanes sp. NPDC051500 TaxID=3363959 RepID=UPI00378A2CEF
MKSSIQCRIKRSGRMSAAAAAAVVMTLSSLLAAAPASAATGSIYVSLPTWLGNCPLGGSVKYVGMSSYSGSTSGYSSDSGDDLAYLRVGINESVQLVGQGICFKSGRPPQYNTPVVNVVVRPTRHGQTFWVGPGGVRSN